MDGDPTYCRNCLTRFDEHLERCSACNSTHIISHPEIDQLSIAHLDCDAFYAAVEKRDNPELRDKAVIVGGGTRGVVTTACYRARISGVRSAMPMFKAVKACPQAVIVKPRMALYREVGRQVRALMQEVTPLVEPISVDEAFLDLSGTQRLHGAPPAQCLMRLAQRIENEIGISVSIGLSHSKYLAKVASDFDKPRGFFVIGKVETLDFLAKQPVSLLWGVGKAFQAKLRRDGITAIGQIQNMAEEELDQRYGSMGRHIWRLAQGQDSRKVTTERRAKSISSERTFSNDIRALEPLCDLLWTLSQDVAEDLKRKGLEAKTVHLKLKTADFKLRTRSSTGSAPVLSAHEIFEPARILLEREIGAVDYRLLGVGVSGLSNAQHTSQSADLFAEAQDEKKFAKVDAVLSDIRGRFGKGSIDTGRGTRARAARHHHRQSAAKVVPD